MDFLSQLLFDVQFEILLFLDAKGILAIGATCKALQKVANHRQVWLACLRNLSDEYAPDLPPYVDIDQLSGPEIKNVAVRAVRACDNWNKEYPEPNREAILRVKNPQRELHPTEISVIDILLVPGGEYVMVRWFRGALQCYHVSTGECVWDLPPRPAGEKIPALKPHAFSVDLVISEGSKQLMILVALTSIYNRIPVMELYRVDVQLKESTTIIQKTFGKHDCLAAHIRGDILLVLSPMNIYLGNWKRGQFVAVTDVPFRLSQRMTSLLKDYVICAGARRRPGSNGDCNLELCVISVLQVLGTPTPRTDSEWGEISFDNAVLASTEIYNPPGDRVNHYAHMFCCEPTWRKERVVSIYVLAKTFPLHPSDPLATKDTTNLVYRFAYKYELAFDSDHLSPTLNFPMGQPVRGSRFHVSTAFQSFSQSGRSIMHGYNPNTERRDFTFYSVHQILKYEDDGELDFSPLKLHANPRALYMEHYSGNIAFVQPPNSTTIIIKYYG